uniref:Uncharacterized protein n=1 Tax=Arundo donax TaxID=35708 RepID=A0A0A9B246_ARUDO
MLHRLIKSYLILSVFVFMCGAVALQHFLIILEQSCSV